MLFCFGLVAVDESCISNIVHAIKQTDNHERYLRRKRVHTLYYRKSKCTPVTSFESKVLRATNGMTVVATGQLDVTSGSQLIGSAAVSLQVTRLLLWALL